jgi:hypothetical protein
MLRFTPLLLLLPAVATAQTAEVVQKLDAKLDAERAAQRNEDVEILRRLLNKAAGLPNKASVHAELVPTPGGQGIGSPELGQLIGDAKQRTVASTPVGPFDGVYLPGAGVVFTLHVPAGVPKTTDGERVGLNSACSTCHRPDVTVHTSSLVPHTSPEPRLSDWERVKQDVRGEKDKPKTADPTAKPKAAVCEWGDLQTVVSGVLAANAKHVRHLPEKEGITVVVTFDEVATGKPTFWGAVEPRMIPAGVDPPKGERQWHEVKQPTDKPGFTTEELKALALGDLHLKQGKHNEAATAYATALARFTDKQFKMIAPTKLTPEQRNQVAEDFQTTVREATARYAKALVLADKPDEAKKALELATEFVVLEVTPATAPSPTAPAKLIVSVSKADVDGAKDAAAVKKAVKVERVNFPK